MSEQNNNQKPEKHGPNWPKLGLAAFFLGSFGLFFLYKATLHEVETNPDAQSDPTVLKYDQLKEENLKAFTRVAAMSPNFAQASQYCGPGEAQENYIRSFEAAFNLRDNALLSAVDPVEFANSLEHAMLKNVAIVPRKMDGDNLAMFFESGNGHGKILLIEKDVLHRYGSVAEFINMLSERDFDLGGDVAVLKKTGKGTYQTEFISGTARQELPKPCQP